MKQYLTSIVTIFGFILLYSILLFILTSLILDPLFRYEEIGDQYGLVRANSLDNFIGRAALQLGIALLLISLFRMNKEEQPLKRFTVFTREEARQTLWGSAWGGILILAVMAFLFIPGLLSFQTTPFTGRELIGTLVLMALIALGEELIARGYILQELSENMNREVAILLSALIFAAMHFTTPDFSWLPVLNLFLAGLLLGVAYVRFNGIWAPVGLHFGWNFMQGPVLGFDVSGQVLPSWLAPEFGAAPEYITGSVYGLEGTVIAVVVQLAAIGWLYAGLKKQEAGSLTQERVVSGEA